MQDEMELREQVTIQLECGHPNKNEGEWCELCRHFVPRSSDSKAAEPQEHKE